MGTYTVVIIALFFAVLIRLSRRNSTYPNPPGPSPFPFIGNLLQIPRHGDHPRIYAQWGKIYGAIMYMRVFKREFVILNDSKVAFDLFEKRSAIYSSRPRLVMAGELVGREKSTLFLPYGERLRETRKLLHSFLRAGVASQHWPAQEKASLELLIKLRDSPKKFLSHVHSSTVSIIMKQVYGYETKDRDDPYVALAEALTQITTKASEPGRWLVDSFPWLRHTPSWFPLAEFKRWAAKARKDSLSFTRAPFDLALSNMKSGSAASMSSFVAHVYQPGSSPYEEEIAMYASASLYNGASDTIASVVRTFILIMATHPEIQQRAQAEVDLIIGSDRLPNMGDVESLDYIDCIIKELHRFSPLIPLVPHSPIEDDLYEGYLIPKGAWVMANVWAMLHDPEVYPQPERFCPERFENRDGDAQPDPTKLAFGFGRRRCPGYHFASASVFLNLTQILWAYDILPPRNSSGEICPPALEFVAGHSVHPKAFDCEIVPRCSKKMELIDRTLTEYAK